MCVSVTVSVGLTLSEYHDVILSTVVPGSAPNVLLWRRTQKREDTQSTTIEQARTYMTMMPGSPAARPGPVPSPSRDEQRYVNALRVVGRSSKHPL